ncbi:MAG: VWA domain-containing protein [Spirochaetales bacterium]|uniref:VWA domain-containing protein n=1 Tax=Candidatus Thalassospirochaeta sargassi TaxID=3119039 RepID=A0AAJ1MP43_9SPIO|nr:VWA domain-containing protein [Spirochaetales bacterium]
MYKILNLLSIILIVIFAVSTPVFSDVRTENIELYLVIDKSKSMVEEISDVSQYINETFVEKFLITGDRLVLIQFYGKADLIYDGIINTDNKRSVMEDISNIPADGRFTDIGNALDRLDRTVSNASGNGMRKYLILLTDGKQEAPPESRYYSPDGSFNHDFLENAKIIQRSGWKIMILGIGQETAVEKLAEELGTTHEVLDFSGQAAKPEVKSEDEIIGRIIAEDLKIKDGLIYFKLSSEGYLESRTIEIEQITYQLPGRNINLLNKAFSIIIESDSEKAVDIEISPEALKETEENEIEGSIIFKFTGDTPFLPAVFDSVLISTEGSSLIENEKVSENPSNDGNNDFNWLIIVIVIILIAAIIAVFIVRNLISHRDEDEGHKKNEISVDR